MRGRRCRWPVEGRFSVSTLGAGYHSVEGLYSGDGNFAATSANLSPDQLVNTPPVAGPDILERDSTNESVAVAPLLTNDWDPDGDPLFLMSVSPTSTQGGVVTNDMDWVSYTPPPGSGPTNIDSFTYEIADTWYGTATGAVSVIARGYLGPAPNLTITNLGNGAYAIGGETIPGECSASSICRPWP